jgi:DNA uptake protein ComE-like DNA-binding protein
MKAGILKTGLAALACVLSVGASSANVAAQASGADHAAKAQKPTLKHVKLVDINSASKAELKSLTGIDAATADKIIAGRPYKSKAFLVSNKIITIGEYEIIKGQIIALQK